MCSVSAFIYTKQCWFWEASILSDAGRVLCCIRRSGKLFLFIFRLSSDFCCCFVLISSTSILTWAVVRFAGNFHELQSLVNWFFLEPAFVIPGGKQNFFWFFVISSIVITCEKQFRYQCGVFTCFQITKSLSGVKHAEPLSKAQQQLLNNFLQEFNWINKTGSLVHGIVLSLTLAVIVSKLKNFLDIKLLLELLQLAMVQKFSIRNLWI